MKRTPADTSGSTASCYSSKRSESRKAPCYQLMHSRRQRQASAQPRTDDRHLFCAAKADRAQGISKQKRGKSSSHPTLRSPPSLFHHTHGGRHSLVRLVVRSPRPALVGSRLPGARLATTDAREFRHDRQDWRRLLAVTQYRPSC